MRRRKKNGDKLKNFHIIALLTFLLPTQLLYSTGLSSMRITINPLSINSNGDVLCKTKLIFNSLGSHDIIPIEYAFVLIKNNHQIIEFPYYSFQPQNFAIFENLTNNLNKNENYFNKDIKWNNPPKSIKEILIQYNFKSNNVSSYKKSNVLTTAELKNNYQLLSNSLIQFTLRNKVSTTNYANNKLLVLYDFPGFFIINNNYNFYNSNDNGTPEKDYGSTFNWLIKYDSDQYISYDDFNIDGIIFKKNSK